MHILSEESIRQIADEHLAFNAISKALVAAYNEQGRVFPVVIGKGCKEDSTFSIKSGHLLDEQLTGLKVGSYWANNHKKGLPNHSSTTLLLDEDTGVIRAVINAGYLNGLRTAAADAVATKALARNDAMALGVLGAGHQSIFEVRAICKVRDIKRVLIHSRTQERAKSATDILAQSGIKAEVADCESVCRSADILVTVTNAREPLFDADWIRPGTHISAMGADQAGKQELPVELVNRAALFADFPDQSRAIGEFETASKAKLALEITAIGAVLTKTAAGRIDDSQITIFDSSGIALQDLCVAEAVLNEAIARNLAAKVEF